MYHRRPSIEAALAKLIVLISTPCIGENVYQHGLGGSKEKAEAIDNAQSKLVNSYDQEVGNKLNAFINKARFFFFNPISAPPALLLQGPSGTGKTYAAHEIADVLDAELIQFTMDGLESFFCLPYSKAKSEFVEDSRFEVVMSSAWNQILNRKKPNFILHVDEVNFMDNRSHQHFIETMKMWLSAKHAGFPTLPMPELKNVPSLRVPIIFTSNYRLDTEKYKAFAARLTYICFPGWSKEKLRDRAAEHLDKHLKHLVGKHSPESINQTKEKTLNLLPFIVKESAQYSPEKVVLKDVQAMIEYAVLELVQKSDKQAPIDLEAIEKYIAADFEEKGQAFEKPSEEI